MMSMRIGVVLAVFLAGCGGATLAGSDTNAADGGTKSDGGTTSTPCLESCLGTDVSWQETGGLAPGGQESSRVVSCTTYVHATNLGGDLSCTDQLDQSCGGPKIGTGLVAGAMSDPDVKAAFAGTTTLFGSDPRGCDGSVFQITYGGKQIEVGEDTCDRASSCGTPPTPCVPVPAGVRTLVTLLQNLDAQELATPTCKSVFPGR